MLTPVVKTSRYDRIARDFEARVQQTGTPVILRRAARSKTCHCVGRTTKQADPDCVFCMGLGHPFDEQLIRAVVQRSSHTQATSTMSERSDVGPIFSPFSKFLLAGREIPKIEDAIVELDFTDGELYHSVMNEFQAYGRSQVLEGIFAATTGSRAALLYGPVWDVQMVTPVQFDGRTIYWEVFTKQLRRS